MSHTTLSTESVDNSSLSRNVAPLQKLSVDYVDSVDNDKAVTHTTHMGPPDSTTGYL